jgi:hypothetical protein
MSVGPGSFVLSASLDADLVVHALRGSQVAFVAVVVIISSFS